MDFKHRIQASHLRQWIVTLVLLLCVAEIVECDWINELTMTSSSPAQGASFGRSVHTYGDFVIIGDNSTRGSASIYIMPDTKWVEQVQLKPPPSEIGSFGHSVGLEASLAVVSAPHLSRFGRNFNYTDIKLNVSANVYVYERNMSSWHMQARFNSLQPGADGFGFSVSIGGSYLVIGAPYATDLQHGDGFGHGVMMYRPNGSILSLPPKYQYPVQSTNEVQKHKGAVYTYRLQNGTWEATGVLIPFMADEMDLFGWSVDISPDGSRLVVGSPGDVVDGAASGSAYVYSMSVDGTWDIEMLLRASDEEPFDGFGYSVGVDGSDVIVGTKTARSAYVFHRMADSWVQDAKLVGSDTQLDDGFGQSVALFGTYAIVGAPLNMERGAAYLWEFDMRVGSWVQIRKFTASLPNAKLGLSVSIGSRFMLASAPSANHDIGHVLSLMFGDSPTSPGGNGGNGNPVSDSIQDVSVLIRFSGSSLSMDLLTTRKILADAAGTGTAQTEVRIVDLNTQLNSHLFGLQVRFTSSPTMSAGTAAQNIINALPEIRYRLNAAVGAVSGTAEILPDEAPVVAESKISLEQIAAIVILILVTIFTTFLTIYLTLQRRKKIAADKREFDAIEAEKEAKRLEASKNKEKKGRIKRPNTVLRSQKRKDRTYMQAENDAAGLEFTDTFFEMEDFPVSPRPGFDDSIQQHYHSTLDLDYDPTERIDQHTDRVVGSSSNNTPAVSSSTTTRPKPDDGPRIVNLDLEDGPGIVMDDSDEIPSSLSQKSRLNQNPSSSLDDGPRIALDLDDGPKLGLETRDDDLSTSSNKKPSPPLPLNDGPTLSLDDGPSLQMESHSHTKTSTTSLNDGPSINMDDDPPSNASESTSVPPLSMPTIAYDSGTDSDSGLSTPNRKRPAAVPRLNLNLSPK